MRYYVTIEGRTIEVDLGAEGITIDRERLTAELATVPGSPVRHLGVQGRSHAVHVGQSEGKGFWDFHLDGERYSAEVVNERTFTIRQMTGAAHKLHGRKPVRAPMPGLVVRVEVEPGSRVQAGQGVVIIEAMKMENELKAEAAGVVKRVLVGAGEAVEKGTVLVEFEDE